MEILVAETGMAELRAQQGTPLPQGIKIGKILIHREEPVTGGSQRSVSGAVQLDGHSSDFAAVALGTAESCGSTYAASPSVVRRVFPE